MALAKRKTIITAVVIVFALTVLGVGAFLFWQYWHNVATDEQKAADTFSQQTNDLGTSARQGEYDEAAYDRLLSEAKSDEQRRSLLIDQSVAAGVNANYDEALKLAQEADALKSDVDTLTLIGQAYEDRGEIAQAIEAYGRAVAHPSASDQQKDIYQRKIAELQARE